jgi:uncharacterized protein (DUF1015 family)
MADVRGFRGIRYNLEDAEAEDLVAPPYDVIDEEGHCRLYERHPHNVIRLILNRCGDEDDERENNRYTRSRRHMIDWLAEGVLQQDTDPGIYVHYQDYDGATGGDLTRRGFMAAVRLTEYENEVVLPHERTLRGPKADRLRLMKESECNLSPIFLLYDDPDNEVDELLAKHRDDEPWMDVETEFDGIRHRTWPVFDQQAQAEVAELLDDKQLLIADGHHRYETALAYRDFRERVAEEPVEDAPYHYVMALLVNMHDPGLQIFPTHRIVYGVEDFEAGALADQLEASDYFRTEWIDVDAREDAQGAIDRLEEAGEEVPSFALMADRWERPLLVRFVGGEDAPVFDEETGEEVRQLDTAILHEAILDRMIGIDKEAQADKRNLHYTRDLDEAVEAADEPENQLVVLMNPTKIDQVVEVCQSGDKMPQKSTYFYPKILSGLAVNPL